MADIHMIYLADIASVGVQHEQFNTSFMRLLTGRNESIQFYGDKTHNEILKKRIPEIQFTDIHVYNQRGGFKEFVRAFHQFRSLKKVVNRAEQNNVDQLVVLLIHPLAHFLFKMFVSPRVDTFVVLHGELESVKFNKHFLNKIWGWFLKTALEKVDSHVSYIVLGRSIYNNLIQVLPDFASQKSIVLDHPYPFKSANKTSSRSNQIVFSSLGVATLAKNSQYLFQVAQRISNAGLYLESKFNVCGRVYKNMQPYLNDSVNYKKGFHSLSRNELNELLSETDYAVFYYENAHYSLCSSGAFWDAIDAEIPLLYVRNDYFDYYSSLVGPLGIAFQTADELNDYIVQMVKTKQLTPDYAAFVENIRELKYNYMSVDNLSRQLALA